IRLLESAANQLLHVLTAAHDKPRRAHPSKAGQKISVPGCKTCWLLPLTTSAYLVSHQSFDFVALLCDSSSTLVVSASSSLRCWEIVSSCCSTWPCCLKNSFSSIVFTAS